MKVRLILGSFILAATTSVFAQTPSQPAAPNGDRMMKSCSQEPDPAKCEAQRKEMRAHYVAAKQACKGKEGPGGGACIAEHMCAKAPDPAKCMTHAKERMEHRREIRDKPKA